MNLGIPTLAGRGGLSAFETKVADLVAQGFSNHDVGEYLKIPEQTVKNHLVRVYRKLGTANRVALVHYAMGGASGS